jgi:hypothetical protein
MSMGIGGVGGMGAQQSVSGASPYAAPPAKMSNLFSQIDSSGTGAISQSQFNQAFQTMNPPGVFRAAGADSVFKTLDPSGSGSVSKQNFVNGMTGLMRFSVAVSLLRQPMLRRAAKALPLRRLSPRASNPSTNSGARLIPRVAWEASST